MAKKFGRHWREKVTDTRWPGGQGRAVQDLAVQGRAVQGLAVPLLIIIGGLPA